MAWWNPFKRDRGLGLDELAKRLDRGERKLLAQDVSYREISIPKRSGGVRRLHVPREDLKLHQRAILHRLLGRLESHPACHGFERGRSTVTHALEHVGKAVVVRMDLVDFFPSTSERLVRDLFRRIGWSRECVDLLTRWCTWEGGLPQGAPTSPRLSNLVNHRLDARLAGFARRIEASYSRYADDLTFSFVFDHPKRIHETIRFTKKVVAEEGYRLHHKRKLHIRRQHQRQIVCGLVVNAGVRLPRETRRWLRAVEHRRRAGQAASLDAAQLAGWRSYAEMVGQQAADGRV